MKVLEAISSTANGVGLLEGRVGSAIGNRDVLRLQIHEGIGVLFENDAGETRLSR